MVGREREGYAVASGEEEEELLLFGEAEAVEDFPEGLDSGVVPVVLALPSPGRAHNSIHRTVGSGATLYSVIRSKSSQS